MKKFYIILIMISSWTAFGYQEAKAEFIILESPVIKFIDGLKKGISGEKIGFTLQIRRAIKKMQYGVQTNEGILVGIYSFNGLFYSLSELAELEAEYEQTGNTFQLNAMKPILHQAKKDFAREIMQFLDIARGAKQHIMILIDESCKKRGRKDSVLRRWGAAKEGTEEKQFDEDVYNFKIFNTFCTDLVNFLQDLINSCPKAQEQFKQMVQSQKI